MSDTNPRILSGNGDTAARTVETTRGVCRQLVNMGYTVLTEFTLANNRRADVIGLSAVPPEFPDELIPASTGLIIADSWGAEEIRPAPDTGLHASRRKALTLRFARIAAERHQRLVDPRI